MADAKMNESGLVLLLRATRFAAWKHKGQRRKDGITPYINHPIAVAENLTNIGGVTDIDTLVAAMLHDTIEDTETTGDEIESHFGFEIRGIVEEVTDDKTLAKAVRKQLQIDHAPHKSDKAKRLKLADKIANLADLISNPPSGWSRERRIEYADWAAKVGAGLRGVNAPLENHLEKLCAEVRDLLKV